MFWVVVCSLLPVFIRLLGWKSVCPRTSLYYDDVRRDVLFLAYFSDLLIRQHLSIIVFDFFTHFLLLVVRGK